MRTRVAPCPTGLLHIGGVRTALYCYLLARKSGGTFFLRIEDTDRAREVPGATENIVRTLAWAGIPPDEGVTLDENGECTQKGTHGPYYQSQRLSLYAPYVEHLKEHNHAYPCFCTPARLEEMRTAQAAARQAPMYDRRCLAIPHHEAQSRIAAGEPHVIRMKVPRDRTVTFVDDIHGDVSFMGHTIDDQVLLKSDGFPTYHLAHVVDDHLMKTDIVIRGEEWLSSLPKHIILFEMLGFPIPRFAHLPLLLNHDRTKLSKRQNDVSASHYADQGYLPEAVVNFLALLGWNPGTEQELFTLPELIEHFSLDRVQKAGAVFDREKLHWLQGQWMRKIPVESFAERIRPLVAAAHPLAVDDETFLQKASLIQERITLFSEAPEMLSYFYHEPEVSLELVIREKQHVTKESVPRIIALLEATLEAIDVQEWHQDVIANALLAAAQSAELKKGQVLWPLRAILTGREYSPGAFEVAAVLGKETTMARVRRAKAMC